MATIGLHVTATNGGQALGGVSVNMNGVTATTDALGNFTSTQSLGAPRITLNGVMIVPRSVTAAVNASRTVNLDAIALDGSFDLNLYRCMVRNTCDAPAGSEPLRRWTRTPNIYLKTVDEVGEAIHGPTLDLIEATIKESIPHWTSGALGTPIIERGTDTRVGVSGWITVRFPATVGSLCGQAQVGQDGGWIELTYHISPAINCRALPTFGVSGVTAAPVIAARTVRHEMGHALGFWHTDRDSDLMKAGPWTQAEANMQPTARELYHAAIAYRRPVGNTSPDDDPTTAMALTPMRVQ